MSNRDPFYLLNPPDHYDIDDDSDIRCSSCDEVVDPETELIEVLADWNLARYPSLSGTMKICPHCEAVFVYE